MKYLAMAALVAAFSLANADTVVSTPTSSGYTLLNGTAVVKSGLPGVADCTAAAVTQAESAKATAAYACRLDSTFSVTWSAPCPAQPAPTAATASCPAGTIGSWAQTSTFASAPKPTCWAAGPMLPASPPAGTCVPAPNAGYTQCAPENATCVITSPSLVIFGAGANFTKPAQYSASVACSNAVFGDPFYLTVKACWIKPDPNPPMVESQPATVTAWVRIADDGFPATLATAMNVRYGAGVTWTTKQFSGTFTCSYPAFGIPIDYSMTKACEVQKTVPFIAQPPQPAMPVVNPGLIPPSAVGYPDLRVRALTAAELVPGSVFHPAGPEDVGAFRVPCGSYSHITPDDPIVFPGLPGASHMHTWAGNVGANASSTADTLLATGNSTCQGGIANRTAYATPTMVDTATGKPIPPDSTNFYYKTGYNSVAPASIVAFPKGLRMIAGSSKTTIPIGSIARFACNMPNATGTWQASIPACPAGGDVLVNVIFPQCWDGKNLDSPDHQSHMAYGIPGTGCPADHPIPLPESSLNIHYTPTEVTGTSTWRLSSDMYVGPGGYSLHADWFGAWDPVTEGKFIANCLNTSMDCHDDLLGNGEILY